MSRRTAWPEVDGDVEHRLGVQGARALGTLSNSEVAAAVDGRSEGVGVSSMSERGITPTGVKVRKCQLSTK